MTYLAGEEHILSGRVVALQRCADVLTNEIPKAVSSLATSHNSRVALVDTTTQTMPATPAMKITESIHYYVPLTINICILYDL